MQKMGIPDLSLKKTGKLVQRSARSVKMFTPMASFRLTSSRPGPNAAHVWKSRNPPFRIQQGTNIRECRSFLTTPQKTCIFRPEMRRCLPPSALRAPGDRRTPRFGPNAACMGKPRFYAICPTEIPTAGTRATKRRATMQEARIKAPQQDCGKRARTSWKWPWSGVARHSTSRLGTAKRTRAM